MFELRWLQRWKFSRIFPFEHPSGLDALKARSRVD